MNKLVTLLNGDLITTITLTNATTLSIAQNVGELHEEPMVLDFEQEVTALSRNNEGHLEITMEEIGTIVMIVDPELVGNFYSER